MWRRPFAWLLWTAEKRAAVASSGEEKVFCPFCCARERGGKDAGKRNATAASKESPDQLDFLSFNFARRILLFSICKFQEARGPKRNFDQQSLVMAAAVRSTATAMKSTTATAVESAATEARLSPV